MSIDVEVVENAGRDRMLREAPCAVCNRRIPTSVGRYGHRVSRPSHGAPGPVSFYYYHPECIPREDGPR